MNQSQSNFCSRISNDVKKGYNKIQKRIDDAEIYDRETFLSEFSKIDITKYIGKSKNRTFIKDDIVLYKSMLFYTDQLREPLKIPPHRKMYWVERLILSKYRLEIRDFMLCPCGISRFDPITQDFTKKNCKNCWVPPCSKRKFKELYGDDWEIEYNKFYQDEKRLAAKKLTGRKSWNRRKGRKFMGCLCKGKNETEILDFIENKYKVTIRRGVEFIGYYVDGYCDENNTIYEVYEKYHKYQKEYDEYRRKELMDHLKCSFVIIYDNDDDNFEEITIKRYAKT